MENNMDKTLELFYKRTRMTELELYAMGGIEDIENCLTFLTREDYISRNYANMSEIYFKITPRGKAFHENGGYAASRGYNQEILLIGRKTLWFAKYGFWITIISTLVGIAALTLVLIHY